MCLGGWDGGVRVQEESAEGGAGGGGRDQRWDVAPKPPLAVKSMMVFGAARCAKSGRLLARCLYLSTLISAGLNRSSLRVVHERRACRSLPSFPWFPHPAFLLRGFACHAVGSYALVLKNVPPSLSPSWFTKRGMLIEVKISPPYATRLGSTRRIAAIFKGPGAAFRTAG